MICLAHTISLVWQIAFVTAHIYTHTLIILGHPFPEIQKQASAFLEEAKKRNQATMTTIFSISLQFFDNVAGNAADPLLMAGPYFDELDKKEGLTAFSSPIMQHFYHMCKMMLAYLIGDYRQAIKYAKLTDGIENFPSGHIAFANAAMFKSLSRIAHCREMGLSRRRTNRRVKAHRERLMNRAITQPSVCSCKLFLIDAELSWLNDRNDAFFHFRNAINCAANERRLLDEALANERLAMYLLEKDDEDYITYLAAAKDAYRRAGVGLKLKQMDKMIQAKVKSANRILTECGESAPGLSKRQSKHA